MKNSTSLLAALLLVAGNGVVQAAAPKYTIIDLGQIDPASAYATQGVNISASGIIVGRTLNGQTGASVAFTSQTPGGSLTALSNTIAVPGGSTLNRSYAIAYGANSSGIAAGTSYANGRLSGAVPVVWDSHGNATRLQLTAAAANTGSVFDVNAAGTAVGGINSSNLRRAQVWDTSTGVASSVPLTAEGYFMANAVAINDSGLIAGQGVDPSNTARNVAMLYNLHTGANVEIPLAGLGNGGLSNGGLINDVSNSGFVTGVLTQNQGPLGSFIWRSDLGTQLIPQLANSTDFKARSVNSNGWVVGSSSLGVNSMPWLYDGQNTYSLAELTAGSGWDFMPSDGVLRTFASATGIADNGTFVGTGVFNGAAHGYAMVLTAAVPEPASYALMLGGLAALGLLARRKGARKV